MLYTVLIHDGEHATDFDGAPNKIYLDNVSYSEMTALQAAFRRCGYFVWVLEREE